MVKQILLAAVLVFGSVATYGEIIIDNADNVDPTWTLVTAQAISANVSADGQGYGGVGRARQLEYSTDTTYRSATYSTTNNIAGNRSSYMNSTLELDFKDLGVYNGSAWVPTYGFPRFFSIKLYGAGAAAGQTIVYDVNVGWTSGLGWSTNQDWHTISLVIANGMPSRAGSLFDGVEATTLTMPTATTTGGLTSANAATFWANIGYIDVTAYTHLDPGVNNAGLLIDNLTLVPEPCTVGLVVTGALLTMVGRRKRCSVK